MCTTLSDCSIPCQGCPFPEQTVGRIHQRGAKTKKNKSKRRKVIEEKKESVQTSKGLKTYVTVWVS